MSDDIFGTEFLDEMNSLETEDRRTPMQRVADAIHAGDPVDVHPAAELFPMMNATDDEGWQKFVEDVKQHGCRQALIVDHEGRLVDGRNRMAAIAGLRAEGVKVRFEVEPCPATTETGIREWVISTNLHRRHLSTSQRAAIAAEMVTATKSSGAKSRSAEVDHVTVDTAAKAMNVSPRQVKKAAQVKRQAESVGKPEVAKAIKEGRTTVNAAAKALTQEAPPKTGKPTPPPAKEKPVALTDQQLAGVRKVIAHANLTQLNTLKGVIVAQIRMLEKEQTHGK